MIALGFAGLVFLLLHVGVSGSAARDRLVRGIGERGYLLGYSLASLLAIGWLAQSYKVAPYAPAWGPAGWSALLADVLMLPAFVLVVAGLLTPNPTSMGQEERAAEAPRGIVRVTRHPFLMGVALWAALHLVANGDVASVLFFGSLLLVCVAGAPSIDAKRRRKLGAAWEGFARQTSIVPFAAVLAGRTRLETRDLMGWRIGVGVVLYALFIGGHRHIVGVSPFPS